MERVLIPPAPKINGGFLVFTAPDTGFHQVLGQSERRKTLLFTSFDLWVIQPFPGTLPRSACIAAQGTTAPIILRYEDLGSIIQGAWFAAGNAIGQNLLIFEGLEY